MTKNKILQLLGVAALALVLVIALTNFTKRDNNLQSTESREEIAESINVSLTVEGLLADRAVTVAVGDTVLSALQQLNQEEPDLLLATKEYSGLGTLVEGMGDKVNGEDAKYWQYFVNGVMPQVGADKFVLQAGDLVEWRFVESEF